MRKYIKDTINLLFRSKNYDEFRDYAKSPKTNKLINCIGLENVVEDGPSIILAKFTGNGREIISLLSAYDSRRLYGVMPESVFNKDAAVDKVKEKWGIRTYTLVDRVAKLFGKPLETILTSIPERLTALQMIPVDLDYHGENVIPKNVVVETIKRYLRPAVDTHTGLAVNRDGAVVFPYGTNKLNARTVATIVCEMYKEGTDVMITPIVFDSGRQPSDKWRDIFLNTILSKTTMYIGKPISLLELMDKKDSGTNPITLVPELTRRIGYRMAKSLYDSRVSSKIKHPEK